MHLQLQYFLLLAAALFCIGIYGLITVAMLCECDVD
jgi:NAD(P)H-quinone oxidoreductase subunit 4L